MLLSMTGHGSATAHHEGRSISVEVRTLNSRYYKVSMRASEGYGALEPRIDKVIRKYVRRGTIQIDLRIEQARQLDDFRVNADVLGSYERQLREIGGQIGKQNEVSWEALLILPGVVEEQTATGINLDEEWGPIKKVTQEALQNLAEMRAGEGRAMGVDLEANCQAVAAELTKIEARAPHVSDGYRTRLTERVNKLLGESEVQVGPDDVIREVALFAERSDISEEVVRLRSHLDQFREIMDLSESNGRKLEFVTQEMFRESNTIGSKANDSEIARHVIEIKSAVERMREMIQNIE